MFYFKVIGRQCDQMAFKVFIIYPFTTMKNCPFANNLPKTVTIFAKY